MTSDPQPPKSPQELRLQVLEMARTILHDAYVAQKTQIHNEWALRADLAWKMACRVPPYPQLPEYFTESDVVQYAHTLLQFVHDVHDVPEPDPQPEPLVQTAPPDAVHTPQVQHQEPEVRTDPQLDASHDEPAPVTTMLPTSEPHAPVSAPQKGLRVLPAWMTTKRG